jgi:tRNA (cmo5U34)-methyltransferase
MEMTRSPSFDPAQFERLSTGSVPGYFAIQELVALAVAAVAPPAGKVLDLGCGTGAGVIALARALPEAELVACDPVAPMVAAARARCEEAKVRARLVVGALPQVAAEAPFDAIVCTLVLHFVPPAERAALVAALRASLRPGGALVVTVRGRSESAEIEEAWARIRRHYAATRGVTAEELAAREAQSHREMSPLLADELRAALVAAGFQTVAPLYQLLAIHSWLAIA